MLINVENKERRYDRLPNHQCAIINLQMVMLKHSLELVPVK